jgi:hypothetical protein
MKSAFLFGALAVLAQVAMAQPPVPVGGIDARIGFEEGRAVFQPFGDSAQLWVTREAAHVKEGRAALKFDYQLAQGQMNAAILIGEAGAAANVKSVRLWAKADYNTTLVMALQERGGGRYLALFHVPENQWQRVELRLSDFFLAEDKDDPKDPNGKLDIELVEAMAIADFNQIFVQGNNESLRKLLGLRTGAHTLYLDEVWASRDALPPTPGVDLKDTNIVDAFAAPQVGWASFGNMELRRMTVKELEDIGAVPAVRERGLWAQYRQRPGSLSGISRRIPRGQLKDMAALKLTVATEKPVVLVIQLEEKSGGKYSTTVELPGESKAMDVRLANRLFTKSDDSKDDNAQLDLDQVQQILIMDASGLMAAGEGDNQLWLSDLRIEPRE